MFHRFKANKLLNFNTTRGLREASSFSDEYGTLTFIDTRMK